MSVKRKVTVPVGREVTRAVSVQRHVPASRSARPRRPRLPSGDDPATPDSAAVPASQTAGLGALAGRPVFAAVLGALTIAFSGILVKWANVEPATAALFRCAVRAAVPARSWHSPSGARTARGRARQVRLAWLAGIFFALDLEL